MTLLRHLPFLLQDLPSLSGDDQDVIDVLKEAGLPKGCAVLDLGCGRGDITIRLAKAFDAHVTGFEGHTGFVRQARQAAEAAGLSARCRFVAGDLRGAFSEEARYDAVLMVAVGPVLGDMATTVGALRTLTKPGGLIVIGDGYLEHGTPPTDAYVDYADRATTEASLIRFGDTIVARRERSPTLAAFNDLTLTAVPRRAEDLKAKHPEIAADLDAYVARQIEEVALMDGPVVPVTWALRRADG
ncbi:methyltransferase domain-containing protein [Roseospira visakhapatnamensis]|uniref:methyltransferase domain-containing protein n=1 Tax=Roseospira visakhapatnamensis TaxID=390880 RepID=UPI00160B7A33